MSLNADKLNEKAGVPLPPVTGSVCPDCGASSLRSVRQEHGVKGRWNYWWIESLCCFACGRTHIPREQGTQNVLLTDSHADNLKP